MVPSIDIGEFLRPLWIQMTVNCHNCPILREASRSGGGCALTPYYYGYFAAAAETV